MKLLDRIPEWALVIIAMMMTVVILCAVTHCQTIEPQQQRGVVLLPPMPPMPVPVDKIFIGSVVIKVQYREILPPVWGPGQCGYHCWAVTDCAEKTIMMSMSIPDLQNQQQAMLHEIMHLATACNDDQDTTLHKAIYQLSEGTLTILKDRRNRNLVKWLFGL